MLTGSEAPYSAGAPAPDSATSHLQKTTAAACSPEAGCQHALAASAEEVFGVLRWAVASS